jgi:hypothetical protein
MNEAEQLHPRHLHEAYRAWRDRQNFPIPLSNQTDLWLWKCFAAGWQASTERRLAETVKAFNEHATGRLPNDPPARGG